MAQWSRAGRLSAAAILTGVPPAAAPPLFPGASEMTCDAAAPAPERHSVACVPGDHQGQSTSRSS
jgi:hypothetical protein